MSIKFRLKGLAETFIERISCPCCKCNTSEDGEEYFETGLSRVTLEGIVVVVSCLNCDHVFIPEEQKHGVINATRLRNAVECDSVNTGEPVFSGKKDVALEVERINAERNDQLH